LTLYALKGDIPAQWPQDLTNYIDSAWSPDGRYLAMVAIRVRAASGQLVIWDLNTGCKEQLTGVTGIISLNGLQTGRNLPFCINSPYMYSMLKQQETLGFYKQLVMVP
jgi:hypothetical protein